MNAASLRNPIAIGLIVIALLILLLNSIAIVPETRQAVVLRFEKPVAIYNPYKPGEQFGQTETGLKWRIPFLDRLVWVDKRVQSIPLEDQRVLSSDQQLLQVDAFARFRVVDPLRMVITAQSVQRVTDQLTPILSSALRNELGKRRFETLLSPERGEVMDNIQKALQVAASQFGVEIVDVRIKHADLPSGSPLDSAFERMRTARRQEATTILAQGLKQAQIIRADADAQAAKIYADSFNKDPQFYAFYRAMQSYKQTFGVTRPDADGETSVILSPNSGYLREFGGQR